MDYRIEQYFGAFYLCLLVFVKHTDCKDIDTYGCYSDVPACGQHRMECPEHETVIVTNARYAHLSRSTPCSRGKVSSCNSRYTNTCCRPSGSECYTPYDDKDAKRLLRPCLGSRTCYHMTPQTNQKCADYMLTKSMFSVVTHRCVPNEYIIGYDVERQVINKLVYLLYRFPEKKIKRGTAHVYGCDVTGPEGAKVKVRALDVAFGQADGGTCSGLEVDKDGDVTSFSCERSDLRFLSTLYNGPLPVAVNIANVGGNPPKVAWVLLEGGGNITVECGKFREIRKIKLPTTVGTDVSQTTLPASVVNTPQETHTTPGDTKVPVKDTTTATSTIPTTVKPDGGADVVNDRTQGNEGKGKTKPQNTVTDSNTTPVPSTSGQSTTSASSRDDVSAHTTSQEASVAVVMSSEQDNTAIYSGIAGGLVLLIIIILIILIIWYRRKRYRRYQSRKIEEERNIPDGEERSPDKTDEDKGKETVNNDDASVGEGQKGDNSNHDSPQQDSKNGNPSNGNKRVKGRKERGNPMSGAATSPPRVSQPRDSDGYTNAGKPYGGDDSPRAVTVEFYDNPGFKTTLDSIKVTD